MNYSVVLYLVVLSLSLQAKLVTFANYALQACCLANAEKLIPNGEESSPNPEYLNLLHQHQFLYGIFPHW